jgi:hypothetical protein
VEAPRGVDVAALWCTLVRTTPASPAPFTWSIRFCSSCTASGFFLRKTTSCISSSVRSCCPVDSRSLAALSRNCCRVERAANEAPDHHGHTPMRASLPSRRRAGTPAVGPGTRGGPVGGRAGACPPRRGGHRQSKAGCRASRSARRSGRCRWRRFLLDRLDTLGARGGGDLVALREQLRQHHLCGRGTDLVGDRLDLVGQAHRARLDPRYGR